MSVLTHLLGFHVQYFTVEVVATKNTLRTFWLLNEHDNRS